MVTTTGRINPSWLPVWALKPLQNSMMLTPCWPRAGPTGGDGFAFPAVICSLTTACTFFAMSEPFDLVVLELHGGEPPEDGHHDLQLPPLGVEIIDGPLEIHEGALDHPHLVPFLEGGLELRLLRSLLHLSQDALDLGQGERDGLGPGPDEAGHLGRRANEMPRIIGHLHLHQQVAGEELLLGLDPLALPDLAYLLVRYHHAADHVLEPENLRARLDRRCHLVLEARVGVDDVPLLGGGACACFAHFRMTPTIRASPTSTAPRYKARMRTTARTTAVDLITSARLGQFTRRNSAATSRKNCWTR